MVLQAGGGAPYAPPATVTEILDRYRERGLQTPITTEVLERAGVPESLSQRTLQALRLLDLIQKDGEPSPELERLSRVPADEWHKGMQDLLTAAYSEVWSFVDPAKDSIERVRDAFRPFNPRGQQERMVTLFLGLCEWVGMDVTAATASRKKPGASDSNGKARTTRRPLADVKVERQAQRQRGAPVRTPLVTPELPPGLLGLLQQIPTSGSGWDKETRDNFLTAFAAVLDFTVPVRPTGLEDFSEDDFALGGDEDEP